MIYRTYYYHYYLFQFPIIYPIHAVFFLLSLYLVEKPGGTMRLYEFVIIFGVLMLILAQVPSFHSLRHINLVSLLLCLAYSACATAGSIHAGTCICMHVLPRSNVDVCENFQHVAP